MLLCQDTSEPLKCTGCNKVFTRQSGAQKQKQKNFLLAKSDSIQM